MLQMDVPSTSQHGSRRSSLTLVPAELLECCLILTDDLYLVPEITPRALSLLQTGNPSQHHTGSEQTGTFPAAGFSHLSWAALFLCSSAQPFRGKMDNMGDLKQLPIKPAQFHSSSRKISFSEAEQALAAGAGGDQ